MNLQTIKRVLLVILTIIAVGQTTVSLFNSWQQPQTQSRIELYQTNLVLNATEWKKFTEASSNKDADIYPKLREQLIGKEPLKNAQKQYEELKTSLTKTQDSIKGDSLRDGKAGRSSSILAQTERIGSIVDELDLRIGILQAEQGQTNAALETWTNLIERSKFKTDGLNNFKTVAVLIDLWTDKSSITATSETQIKANLDGWFKYRSLAKLYQVEQRPADLANLELQQQNIAEQVVNKLLLVGVLPVIGLLIGTLLILGLTLQLAIRKKRSILATNSGIGWKTPWDIETISIVLIVGFFTVKDIVLPIVLGLILSLFQINPTKLDNLQQVMFSFVAYIGIAVLAVTILFFAIKKYFPLPPDWFKFKLTPQSIAWGIGGYLTAIPLVIIISLINQQLWGDRGGGNPILPVALQGQDNLAKFLLFLTACIAAPIFEELIFRGFLLASLTRYLPVWGAITVSGLIFAVAHLSLSEVIPLTVLGMLLGFVYTRSRNLLSSMLMHALWNSGTLITLFILGSGNS
ncbi:CPBP family intramembrane glutamic endopeptidase [Merismopedia glauca]|uniref:CPBP family intramembrane metalloprotease domain-containing protein n=1 Tax=Merismopedia glauca CCAP 1448/3 TaxID=1296344 RepID=A0A2T1C3V7_9CYAN|nr:CPBP family intramembrane glutamic endopeptidase [Merismopedia glauca]PSB02827.1 CPBP family intramembrane metalloprotease domain-containing protein [Merismopedia glauca CCAP 1448/3]